MAAKKEVYSNILINWNDSKAETSNQLQQFDQ
jgi:hypothetical protein